MGGIITVRLDLSSAARLQRSGEPRRVRNNLTIFNKLSTLSV
jgi:hypothetical protein